MTSRALKTTTQRLCAQRLPLLMFLWLFSALIFCLPTLGNEQSQLELLNTMNRMQLQMDLQKMDSQLKHELEVVHQQQAKLSDRMNQRDSDLGNYIDAISWISGIVIGFVGIIFGIGAFILYRENQDVTRKAQKQLELFNERAADQQKTFKSWFDQAKKGYALELEQLGRIMRLRTLLDQDQPASQDIYPDLSPLYAHPKLEYLPIFKKVMTLDIGADIKRSTQAAIDQLAEMHRQE